MIRWAVQDKVASAAPRSTDIEFEVALVLILNRTRGQTEGLNCQHGGQG